jgi:subfamily B ATP-binding cassette protein MsbA
LKGIKALTYIFKTYMKRHYLQFLTALIFLSIAAALYALEVFMIKFIFDDLLNPFPQKTQNSSFVTYVQKFTGNLFQNIDKEKLFILIPIVLIVIFLLKGVFNYFGKYLLDKVGLEGITDLRDALYERLIKQGNDFFSFYPTGSLISRLLNDVERIKTAVSEKLTEVATAFLSLIALIGSAFYQDYKLTLISMVTIPLVVIPIAQFSKNLRKVSRKSQEELANLADQIKETLEGVSIVQMFSMENKEIERFKKANKKLLKVNLKATKVMALTTPLMEFIGAFAVAGILYYGHFKISSNSITLGAFSAFLATLYAMYVPIKKLSQANNIVQQAVSAAERSVELIESDIQVKEKENAITLPPFSKSIKFENVSFAYIRGEKVLDGIDLEIKKGVKVALVGPSGGGKSTLVSLIPRLFDPTEGRILIDGIDIRDVTLKSLRSQIGMVTQDTILFNLSARDNISYGDEGATFEKIKDASEKAKADGFISSMPEGYDTLLGESGSNLSGGQRQRIAIARALLKNPPILILDEATSSLDSESEFAVSEAIKELMKGRTTIVIAHRLATVVNSDITVVIDNGKIVEIGKHYELIKKSGLYAQLCEKEFKIAKEALILEKRKDLIF